jgi:predicted amidohydrolase
MRIAAFQRFPIFDDAEAAADVILSDLLWADAHGVDLALFSESYLQGHSYRQSLIERRAVSLDSPVFLSILEKLAPTRATAVIG